ncbi:MAG: hypothetical protein JWN75_574 [Candidatus Saccharibacteria bacterium]|nr:hypothetical protein [Candidatus Saccharibacteria bacterium]
MVSEMTRTDSTTQTATQTNDTARTPRLESAGFFNTKNGDVK